MANLPSPFDEWIPLAPHQFLNAAVSTALTVPSITSQGGNIAAGSKYVCILTCQGVQAYIRLDGVAVTAALTGGKLLNVGDVLTIYGIKAIQAARIIRSADGGTVAAEFYYFKPAVN